ncbi:ABC transporter permease [Schinkia sp. CFF1]
MSFLEGIRISLRSIVVNKLRSLLTMLGIIIGIASVIVMVAIGEGSSSSISSQINGLGSNLLIVSSNQARQGGISLGAGSSNSLTMEDIDRIKEKDSIAGAVPSVVTQGQAVAGNANYNTTIEGTTQAFLEVRNASIQRGRFFNRFEVERQANVAVVGTEVVSNLFGSDYRNPIGETIEIQQIPFTIIGVLASQGNSGMTNNDDKILIPVTTAMNRMGASNIRTIYISAKSEQLMEKAQFDVTQALRASHGLKPSEDDDFQISSQSQILETAQSVSSVMTTLLSGIAAISLVVGGIGIMNIMLVSVTERTREIGIRKAIGATQGDILQQFLIESIILCLFGGVLGILFGVGAAQLLSKVTDLTITFTIKPMIYAFLSSLFVGVIFGVYPARKAAKLKPIDALRYE